LRGNNHCYRADLNYGWGKYLRDSCHDALNYLSKAKIANTTIVPQPVALTDSAVAVLSKLLIEASMSHGCDFIALWKWLGTRLAAIFAPRNTADIK
jgi:hypothetical protein